MKIEWLIVALIVVVGFFWFAPEPTTNNLSHGQPNFETEGDYYHYCAIHEAGHAAACLALGGDVTKIILRPLGHRAGGTTSTSMPADNLEARVQVNLAGYEAVKLFLGIDDRVGPSDDLEKARKIMSESEIWAQEEVTASLLMKHKRAVFAIAKELERKKALSGERVRAIFERYQ